MSEQITTEKPEKPKVMTALELLAELKSLPSDEYFRRVSLLQPRERTQLYKISARESCKTDLLFLANKILGYAFKDDCYKALSSHLTSSHDRHLTLWPRETGKTTIGTVAGAIQALLKNPNERILIISDTEDLARRMLSMIKAHFTSNDQMKLVWPEYCSTDPNDYGTKLEFTLPNKTEITLEPSIMIAGRETTLTSKHFTMIFCDDLVTEGNAKSKEMCDQVIEKFQNLSFLMSKGCRVFVSGTRYHNDDLYGFILKNYKDEYAVDIKAIEDADGNLLCPLWYPRERIESKKKSTTEYQYWCQMMNQPINPDTAIFNTENVKSIDEKDVPQNVYTFTTVDPAISITKDSDYFSMVTMSVDQDFNIYVRDIENSKMLPDQAIETMIEIHEKFKPFNITIEDVAFQKALAVFFRKICKERNLNIKINEIKRDNKESKFQRICALQPKVKYGEFYIVNGCRNKQALLDQMAWYSQDFSGHDDILDAVSDILRVGFKPSVATREERPRMNTGIFWEQLMDRVNSFGDSEILGNENISGNAIPIGEILSAA